MACCPALSPRPSPTAAFRSTLRTVRMPAVTAEESVAEIAVGKRGVGGDPAGEAALVQGDPNDDADAVLGAGGKQVLLRRLMERVVDDLHGVDVTAAHQVQGVARLVVVDRHAEEPDLPLALEVLDGFQPVAAAHPLVAPDVELEQVERLQAGRAQALLQAGPDVVAGEGLGRVDTVRRGPYPVLRRHLGRHVERIAAVLADDRADDALAFPVTPGGVDEVHAEFDGPVQGAHGLVLLRADPPRSADAPRPVPDLGDRQARLPERTIMHASSRSRRGPAAAKRFSFRVHPTGTPFIRFLEG